VHTELHHKFLCKKKQGRQLSLIFLKLPSKHDYPDYYDIIKRPIDLEKIYTKASSTPSP
jgi:protein polybromo-1